MKTFRPAAASISLGCREFNLCVSCWCRNLGFSCVFFSRLFLPSHLCGFAFVTFLIFPSGLRFCLCLGLLLLLLLPVVLCVLCVWCVCEHVCGVCGVCVRVVDDRVRVCASEVLGYLKQEELPPKEKNFSRVKNFFPKRRTSLV